MESLIIELLKLVIPSLVALVIFWVSQKRAKSLGIDDTAKQYEDIQAKLKAALQEDLEETKKDFVNCKERLVIAEATIEDLKGQVREQDQIIFNLRLDISSLQRLRGKAGGRQDGPN